MWLARAGVELNNATAVATASVETTFVFFTAEPNIFSPNLLNKFNVYKTKAGWADKANKGLTIGYSNGIIGASYLEVYA